MKAIKTILLTLTIVFFFSCDKEDDVDKPDPVGAISLEFPADEEMLVYTQPKFEWKAFETEKLVTYTILLGTDLNNLSTIKSGVSDLFVTVDEVDRLEAATTYFWKIQAFEDDKLIAESITQSFETETISPYKVVENAPYSKRKAAGIAAFKDKIWIVGGKNEANEALNDIWSSVDGINWANEGVFPFETIYSHKLIAFNNKLWIYGGVQRNTTLDINTVSRIIYSSENGKDWIRHEESFPVSQYSNGLVKMINHKNKLYRIGGYNGTIGDNTEERYVYSTSDGLHWNLEAENNGLLSKFEFLITEFNNLIYCFDYDSEASTTIIKSSSNGIDWQEAGSYNYKVHLSWEMEMFTIDDKLILLNPAYDPNKSNGYFEETTDGYNWQTMTSDKNETTLQMGLYELVILNDEIYAVGGAGFRYSSNEANNDVWKLN